jgi:predicted outer membrane protein
MRSSVVGLMAVGLFCGVTLAQQAQPVQPRPGLQPLQPGQPRAAAPGAVPGQTGQGQSAQADQQIAAKIYGACHNEVELAKFVQSRLQSQEAKQFAEKMIKDHTPDCEAYAKFAGQLAHHQPAGGQRAGGQAGGQVDWVSIHKELAQQCLQSTQKELAQKQGAELDKCYMTQQVMAHMEMKDKLTVLKNHVSPQLAQQIDKSLEGVNGHLKEAQQIVEQMKDRPSERVSRRPEGNK